LALLMPWLLAAGERLARHRAALLGASLVFYVVVAYAPWPGGDLPARVNDRPFVYWVPYALLGLAWFGMRERPLPRAWPLAVAVLLLVPFEAMCLVPPNAVQSFYVLPSVFVATACLLWLGSPRPMPAGASPGAEGRLVALLATHTMGIFVLNPAVVLMLEVLFSGLPPQPQPAAAVLLPLLSGALALALSLGATLVLKRTAAGRYLLG
jgi:surface polysaccharide O-acyltransferase-like enzyme